RRAALQRAGARHAAARARGARQPLRHARRDPGNVRPRRPPRGVAARHRRASAGGRRGDPPAGRARRGDRPGGAADRLIDLRYSASHPTRGAMTSLTADAPPTVIRWPYLGYAVIAIGVMIAAIVSHDRWFLNFVHVICGVMWTGIDLFMGFIVGPILRRIDITARREVIVRLVPKTLFLMPTLAIITGTSGWYLAKDLGLLDLSW